MRHVTNSYWATLYLKTDKQADSVLNFLQYIVYYQSRSNGSNISRLQGWITEKISDNFVGNAVAIELSYVHFHYYFHFAYRVLSGDGGGSTQF